MSALVAYVQQALAERANPDKAGPMAAYMKTDMPFYGVQRPARKEVERGLRRFALDRDGWEEAVLALWALPHREEKYVAIALAEQRREHHVLESVTLFERLVREGAWWDLVDPVAANLLGAVWAARRDVIGPKMDRWIEDPDLWIRRTALIGQLRHRADTDADRLFRYCLARADEREFFIRKAIGWALRAYSKTAPDAVGRFLLAHRDALSGLSYREGAKVLARQGVAPFA